jgi:hypothetical protein
MPDRCFGSDRLATGFTDDAVSDRLLVDVR